MAEDKHQINGLHSQGVSRAAFLSGRSRVESVFLSFPAFRGCSPWLLAPASIFKVILLSHHYLEFSPPIFSSAWGTIVIKVDPRG